jgi:hypothetical protein
VRVEREQRKGRESEEEYLRTSGLALALRAMKESERAIERERESETYMRQTRTEERNSDYRRWRLCFLSVYSVLTDTQG